MSSSKTWISVIPDGDAGSDLQPLYDEVRDSRGHVDHILSIHSLHPESLQAHYALYLDAMRGTRDLSRARREMIAVLVSALNGCVY